MSQVDQQRRRRFTLMGIVLCLLAVGFYALLGLLVWQYRARMEGVETHWTPDGLFVGTYMGYPYIVTHLYGVTHVGSDGLGQGCIARLPYPIVFIDSDNVTISNGEFKALEWVDKYGNKIEPPQM